LPDLERAIRVITEGVEAQWGIYVKFLRSGQEIAINADVLMDTMSVIKVPLLVTLMRDVEAGKVDLDQRAAVDAPHRRWGTGVLSAMDDGLTISLRDAASLMIGISDNLATDLCFEAVGGPERVTQHMQDLGLTSIQATGTAYDWFRAVTLSLDPGLASLSPAELYLRGYPAVAPLGKSALSPAEMAAARELFHFGGGRPFGLSTARDIGRLIEMIQGNEVVSPTACATILDILRHQQYATRIPKYLENAIVAHKTGDFGPFIANDVGLIEPYGMAPVVVSIFTSKHRDTYAYLEDAVARISEKVWQHALEFEGAKEPQRVQEIAT
jgi:beta-lactamase class A